MKNGRFTPHVASSYMTSAGQLRRCELVGQDKKARDPFMRVQGRLTCTVVELLKKERSTVLMSWNISVSSASSRVAMMAQTAGTGHNTSQGRVRLNHGSVESVPVQE